MAGIAQTEIEKLMVASPRLDRWLDRFAGKLQEVIDAQFERTGPEGIRVRNFLNGIWLGHSLHAPLTDVPTGSWTAGMLFDYLGQLTGDRYLKRAGDWATAVGAAGGVAAAVAGAADFSEVRGEAVRFGGVHALLNGVAMAAYLTSLVQRFRGNRATALAWSTLGYAVVALSSDLGGQMVYRYGVAVNREAWAKGPSHFVPVLRSDALPDGELRAVEAGKMAVLLARVNGRIYAIGDVCTHWGCSLATGTREGTTVRCPCHGSIFRLSDGEVLRGPASVPEPTFDVREQNGQIEVRENPY
jgi:nitrite reductase/ring-hydroxylating ferredoxin subunit/uncharacterized membrane protein